MAPALTLALTFKPRATVWLRLLALISGPTATALVLVLTFSPLAIVWLWLVVRPSVLTFIFIRIVFFSFSFRPLLISAIITAVRLDFRADGASLGVGLDLQATRHCQ